MQLVMLLMLLPCFLHSNVCSRACWAVQDRNRMRKALDKMHERHANRRVSKLARRARRESAPCWLSGVASLCQGSIAWLQHAMA